MITSIDKSFSNFGELHHMMSPVNTIVVTYVQFDSNILVLYVFLGFLKNT